MGGLFEITVKVLMTLVFATAAAGKLRHAATFEGVVANFRVLPTALNRPFARILPWLELAIAALIWAPGPLGVLAQVVGALLLLVFAVAIALNIGRGRREIDCGCFQTAGRQPLSWTLVARNHVLAAALAGAAASNGAPSDPLAWANGGAAGLALFLIYLGAGELAAVRTRAQPAAAGAKT